MPGKTGISGEEDKKLKQKKRKTVELAVGEGFEPSRSD